MKKIFILISIFQCSSNCKNMITPKIDAEIKNQLSAQTPIDSQNTDTLAMALREALETDFDIKLKKLGTSDADIQYKFAVKTLVIPELSLSVSNTAQKDHFRANRTTKSKSSKWNSQATASLRHNLFKGGADLANIQTADFGVKIAQYDVLHTIQNVLRSTIEAYVDFTISKELLKVAKEHYENAQKIAIYSERLSQGGVDTKSPADLPRAKAELEKAKANFLEAESQRIAAKGKLEDLTNGKISDEAKAPKLNFNHPENLEAFKTIICLKNPGIIKLKMAIAQSESAVKAAQAGLLPNLDLVLETHTGADIGRTNRGSSANLELKWIPYNVSQQKNVKQAYIAIHKSKIEHAKELSSIHKTAEILWAQYSVLVKEMGMLEKQVKFLSQALKIMQRELLEGLEVSQIDLLRGTDQLLEARQQLVKKQGDILKLQTQIAHLKGELSVSCSMES